MAKYYDINDIITEEESVSVIFQKAASGVGIDPSAEMDFIEAGSKVELPFWLAHELQLRQAVSVNVPPCFNQKTRLEIQADSASVDLRSRCPFFYEFGCKMAPICICLLILHANIQLPFQNFSHFNIFRTIGFLLLSAFKSRYKEVLTKAHTTSFEAGSKFWTILTKEEINFYETAQSAMTSFKKWRMGGARFQIASILRRKRKPTE
ncbi:putative GINS complex, subunit Psf3, GINS subunit, domain A protein [Lupinus albus]|uniref:Putative GINS complex, subunit Psf3, GINS subunit, domain A protein n=1 Tax=Lupinus albus TaxID=3870 RepID=A0A6A4R371_LUPAL|nr:putative GINS complex, subunit Psf3, GINS subunit, domain A protein [Lupinus albus]